MDQQINNSLLEYHHVQGFKLYDSFPIISDDPTVLFTNATITPFKHFFDGDVNPHNYALVQRCLRVGGGAGELETTRIDPNYSSLFEMFGSGLFDYSYRSAVEYFLSMLNYIGLPNEKLLFVVPESSEFTSALITNGIKKIVFCLLKKTGHFGKNGILAGMD